MVYRSSEQIDHHPSTVVGSRSTHLQISMSTRGGGIGGGSGGGGGGGISNSNVCADHVVGGGGVDASHGSGTTSALGVERMDPTGDGSHLHTPTPNNITNPALVGNGAHLPVSSEVLNSSSHSITPSINDINRPTGGSVTRSGSDNIGVGVGVDNQPPPTGTQPGQGLDALNILVVDDSPANRKMVVRMLKLDGHRCVEAIDGLAAVGAVSRSMIRRLSGEEMPEFDVILMDKNMPKMSGPDAAREMRRIGLMKPIIGITGSDDNVEFIQAGMLLFQCTV